jgi:hypothetical protein
MAQSVATDRKLNESAGLAAVAFLAAAQKVSILEVRGPK